MDEKNLYNSYDKNLYKIGYVPDSGSAPEADVSNNLSIAPASNELAGSSAGGAINPNPQDPDTSNSGASSATVQALVDSQQGGKTKFDNTETGYILGIDKGVAKFYIGSPTAYMNWDGVNLIITGSNVLTESLADGNIFVGNASNIATGVTMGGDATIISTGVLTLATVNSNVGSFTNADITVDAKGRITAASSGAGGGITYTVNADENVTTYSTNPMIPDADLGWTISGTPTLYANGFLIQANTTGSARIRCIGLGSSPNPLEFGTATWRARMKAQVIPANNANPTTTSQYSWFGFSTAVSPQAAGDIADVTDRVGLSFYDGKIYFITANGASVTATQIATRAADKWDEVVVDFDNTTARVWLNGVAYTSTTNVPNSGDVYANMGGYNSGGSAAGIAVIAPVISTQYNA